MVGKDEIDERFDVGLLESFGSLAASYAYDEKEQDG